MAVRARILAAPLVALAVATVRPMPADAQQQRASVEVVGRTEGVVGERLVYLVREEFRRSSAFQLVGNSGLRLQVVIATLPRDESAPAAGTIYGVVWNMVVPTSNTGVAPPIFVDTTVGYAGANVVSQAAQTIVARTERMIDDAQRAAK